MNTLLQNAVIVTAAGLSTGDVAISGELISAIGPNLSPSNDCRCLDLQGAYLLPGGIDAHTHFDMPAGEISTSDDFFTGTRAAISGGTTSIIDFAEPEPGQALGQGLNAWHRKADGRSFCDYGFHMTVSGWSADTAGQMAEMAARGVSTFKLYTANEALRVSDDILYQAFREAKALGSMIMVHCENGPLIQALAAEFTQGELVDIANYPRTRPALVEKEAVSRVIDIARLAGAEVYIVHLSAAESLETAGIQRDHGAQIFLETCPQYLLLDDSHYRLPDFESAKYVMAPPLRGPESLDALWRALADDRIQTVCTDHCSFNYAGQKDLGRDDFTRIPAGIPSVEHRLTLMYTYGVKPGRINLPQLAALCSTNAAKLFGLYPLKGEIAPGSEADLVVLEDVPAEEGLAISADRQNQQVDYTPYEGWPLGCRIRQVYMRGRCVVDDGRILSGPEGRFLHRSASGSRGE